MKKESYPSRDRLKRFLDQFVALLGVGNIIATLPQVLEIWMDKDAAGVSSVSWGYYTFFSTVLLIYGIVHREKPIILTYAGGVVQYLLILIGSILY